MKPKIKHHLGFSKNGFHRLAYQDWGKPLVTQSTLLCVHGLTRNSGDFDFLAHQLKDNFHVICPDIVGRGKSDWLGDPSLYNYSQYLSDMACLFSRLKLSNQKKIEKRIDWIGTSMGGLLGMLIAAQNNSPIHRLILNDIGPEVPQKALLRIKNYIEGYPTFKTLAEAKAYIKEGLRSFGNLIESQWDHITNASIKKEGNTYIMSYDPELITAYQSALENKKTTENSLWDIWKNIKCPILLLRGLQSDVLENTTVMKMKKLKPDMEIVEFDHVGHAPALMDLQQTDVIKKWLNKGSLRFRGL